MADTDTPLTPGVDVLTRPDGGREILYHQTPVERAELKTDVLLGFDTPEGATGSITRGDVGRISRVHGTDVTITSLTSQRRRVYKVDELQALPTVILVTPPREASYAVEEGAWYQDPTTGQVLKCQNRMWVDAITGKQVLLPVFPRLILRKAAGV